MTETLAVDTFVGSPYWIESYEETHSSFKNMGLWQYCFKDFVYPKYHNPKQFTGCHNIFSHVSKPKLKASPVLQN